MQRIMFRMKSGTTRLIPFTELTRFPKDPIGSEKDLCVAAELAMEIDDRIKGYELVGEPNDIQKAKGVAATVPLNDQVPEAGYGEGTQASDDAGT